MNQTPKPASGSLIERAADLYNFRSFLPPKDDALAPVPVASVDQAVAPPLVQQIPLQEPIPIDRQLLRDGGFIIPGTPPSALSEEFRLVKRQLLLRALGGHKAEPVHNGRLILICSAQPNEGKTFCSVNLALSIASETDIEVLLVDADVAKPEVLSTLGLPGGMGLMDALADPSIDAEQLVIKTDIPNLSVLPAGR